MSDVENAEKVLEVLSAAEHEAPEVALPVLNGIAGLIRGDPDDLLEVQEARTDTFMAICEIGKALHRGQPAGPLWGPAFEAARRWRALL